MNQIIQVKQAAAVFKALGDENRIRILLLLGGGELCACKLLEYLQISQSTLSHHMKILCDAGIVTGRKEGQVDPLFHFPGKRCPDPRLRANAHRPRRRDSLGLPTLMACAMEGSLS